MIKGFDDFLGNVSAVKGLKSMIASGRVSHAYIFDGAYGTGKKTLAYAFAKALQCENGAENGCGKCYSCKALDSGEHPDVFFVDTDKTTIGVDVIRDEIIDRAKTKPYSSKYKIFILNGAERLTEQAQNALLKTIEEPPAYGVFILLVSNYNKLLVTVLSRCVLIRLNALGRETLERELLKTKACDRQMCGLIAECAGGSLGEALRLCSDEGFFTLREKAAKFFDRVEAADLMGLYEIIDEAIELDKSHDKGLDSFLSLIYLFYRDLLVFKTCGEEGVIQKDYLGLIEDICGRLTLKKLIKGSEAVSEARREIGMNVNKQLCLEQMLFKIKEK
ncbi:MAG: DNA polymerase III subunit delta' [Clostridiales bacterium]|nr:DNA polymerase III subunit delta' [Clostridiales bacterium]